MKPESDPVLLGLSELPAAAPRQARDAMVRARCHAAMTATARQRTPAASGAFDRLLPVAVVVYAIAVVAEAIRISWLSVS
ncbi:MAG TPA: hypothetical protein VFO31_27455 [Vicinamibacterales bacterium]|nr:hypothetical protein [Vicinamibacterales bacterium]